MTTKTSASAAAARKTTLARIAETQKQADAAKKSAKVFRIEFRQAKQAFKYAKRAAKKLRKAVKGLKAELTALTVKRVRPKRAAAKPVASKLIAPKLGAKPSRPMVAPPVPSAESAAQKTLGNVPPVAPAA